MTTDLKLKIEEAAQAQQLANESILALFHAFETENPIAAKSWHGILAASETLTLTLNVLEKAASEK